MKNLAVTVLLSLTCISSFAQDTYKCEGSIRGHDTMIAKKVLTMNDNGFLVAELTKGKYKVSFTAHEDRGILHLSVVDWSEKGKVAGRTASAKTFIPTALQPETQMDIQLADGSFVFLDCNIK